ncbi:hypothetical protein FACS1894176_00380 [Bacteroidia bacterium]|nr:hypothetical protein FACS1894176_00380 [Bacteroidia bacterium]
MLLNLNILLNLQSEKAEFMKNITKICACLFVLSGLFLASCEHKSKIVPSNNVVCFDSIQTLQTYCLNNDTTQPCCNINILFYYPDSTDKHMIQSLQSLFIEKMFGGTFAGETPKQAVDEYVKQYIHVFQNIENQKDTAYLDEENQYVDETGFLYYIWLKNKILFNDNGYVSFTVESLVYEGGAYASKTVFGYVVNTSTGKLLTEDQFAGKNYKKHLSEILAQKLAEANKLKSPNDLEDLGYSSLDDIVPNGNFTLDGQGITYYFNEGDIAGTSVGMLRVFIPYNELKVYLADENSLIAAFSGSQK